MYAFYRVPRAEHEIKFQCEANRISSCSLIITHTSHSRLLRGGGDHPTNATIFKCDTPPHPYHSSISCSMLKFSILPQFIIIDSFSFGLQSFLSNPRLFSIYPLNI